MENNDRPLDVSVVACEKYEPQQAKAALLELLAPLGGLSFVKPGDRVVIKANLITFLKPDKAATTHPVLLSALTELLVERGHAYRCFCEKTESPLPAAVPQAGLRRHGPQRLREGRSHPEPEYRDQGNGFCGSQGDEAFHLHGLSQGL